MFPELLERLLDHEDLTAEASEAAMTAIMRGEAGAATIAAFLVALRAKGERPAELVGLARAMRAAAVPLATPVDGAFDTCGTGGDGAGTINVSSLTALVVAACGVPVAKHGNRSVSSRCGSADLLQALGVKVEAPPAVVERSLRTVGIAFFFAPTFHPAMRHAAPVRKELGVRSAFNLLGPLTNPAGVSRQLVGVPRPELTEVVARALGLLGAEYVWVVHSADGLDELSTTGYSKVSECRRGVLRTFYVLPSDFGLPKAHLGDLLGGDTATNAAIAREVLGGRPGAPRDIVLLNAGAALFVAGRAASVKEGIEHAARVLDEGRAAAVLDRMVEASHEMAPANAQTAEY